MLSSKVVSGIMFAILTTKIDGDLFCLFCFLSSMLTCLCLAYAEQDFQIGFATIFQASRFRFLYEYFCTFLYILYILYISVIAWMDSIMKPFFVGYYLLPVISYVLSVHIYITCSIINWIFPEFGLALFRKPFGKVY
jgi:hypothetical protein